MSLVDEIKARIDIVELIGETVELRRSGKNYIGFCPFHHNTRTPAFAVFPETGTWRCFGECNTGGDVFTFVMKKEGWTFRQALEYLARRAGLDLKAAGGAEDTASEHREWYDWMAEAALFYQDRLRRTEGEPARAYLARRGLQPTTIEAFGLGYAPAQGDALVRYFAQRGVAPARLVPLGLVRIQEDTQAARDLFRHRIMFPIRDARGRVVGFGARTLDPDGVPKYLNSPTTPLFDKTRLLYGLDRAARAIRRKDRAVLVEGYMDVLALHQAGYEETVSPMGTSLTPEQMKRLKALTRNVYLALDPDPAGQKALWRSLEVAPTQPEPVLDARGLLYHEQRLDLNLRVVVLPEGRDPDEIVLEDPEAWERLLAQARPLVLYLMHTLAREYDLQDPKARNQLARRMLPLIRLVASPVEREAYLQELAALVRTPVDQLRRWRSDGPVRGRTGRQDGAGAGPSLDAILPVYPVANPSLQERVLLAVLWKYPDLLARVQRELRARRQEPLSASDFSLEEHRQAWAVLEEGQRAFVPWKEFLAQQVRERGLEPLMQHMEELLAPVNIDLNRWPLVVRDLVHLVLHLRRARVTQALRHLEDVLSQRSGAEDLEWLMRLRHLSQERRRIEEALNVTLATGEAPW